MLTGVAWPSALAAKRNARFHGSFDGGERKAYFRASETAPEKGRIWPETNRRSFMLGFCGLGLISIPGARVTLAASKISLDDKSVLIVVDVQNCFLPGGSLAVTNGDQVIPIINRIAKAFSNVVLTQDWHTPGHISFASAHSGTKPFETIKLPYGDQVLWPDHCVQGTSSADISKDISTPRPS
jgi:nicotinamidase/pyrazinamidase